MFLPVLLVQELVKRKNFVPKPQVAFLFAKWNAQTFKSYVARLQILLNNLVEVKFPCLFFCLLLVLLALKNVLRCDCHSKADLLVQVFYEKFFLYFGCSRLKPQSFLDLAIYVWSFGSCRCMCHLQTNDFSCADFS